MTARANSMVVIMLNWLTASARSSVYPFIKYLSLSGLCMAQMC